MRSIQDGTARVSSPRWHANAMLVLHVEPRASAYPESAGYEIPLFCCHGVLVSHVNETTSKLL